MRQGRTDAWIAHQLDVSVKDISAFKSEHELEAGEAASGETDLFGPRIEEDEPDLRAEDEALVAAALEAEQDEEPEEPAAESGSSDEAADDNGGEAAGDGGGGEEGEAKPRRRRRGRRGGRGRGKTRKALDGTFDHGEDGYGLWLDPEVQDDPVYAEHWAGHRTVSVAIENDRIVITRAGENAGASSDDGND